MVWRENESEASRGDERRAANDSLPEAVDDKCVLVNMYG